MAQQKVPADNLAALRASRLRLNPGVGPNEMRTLRGLRATLVCSIVCSAVACADDSRTELEAVQSFMSQCGGCSLVSARLVEDEVVAQTFQVRYRDMQGASKVASVVYMRESKQWLYQ